MEQYKLVLSKNKFNKDFSVLTVYKNMYFIYQKGFDKASECELHFFKDKFSDYLNTKRDQSHIKTKASIKTYWKNIKKPEEYKCEIPFNTNIELLWDKLLAYIEKYNTTYSLASMILTACIEKKDSYYALLIHKVSYAKADDYHQVNTTGAVQTLYNIGLLPTDSKWIFQNNFVTSINEIIKSSLLLNLDTEENRREYIERNYEDYIRFCKTK